MSKEKSEAFMLLISEDKRHSESSQNNFCLGLEGVCVSHFCPL